MTLRIYCGCPREFYLTEFNIGDLIITNCSTKYKVPTIVYTKDDVVDTALQYVDGETEILLDSTRWHLVPQYRAMYRALPHVIWSAFDSAACLYQVRTRCATLAEVDFDQCVTINSRSCKREEPVAARRTSSGAQMRQFFGL